MKPFAKKLCQTWSYNLENEYKNNLLYCLLGIDTDTRGIHSTKHRHVRARSPFPPYHLLFCFALQTLPNASGLFRGVLVAFAYPESLKKQETFPYIASFSSQKLQKLHLVLKVDKLPPSSFQKAFQELFLEKLQLI